MPTKCRLTTKCYVERGSFTWGQSEASSRRGWGRQGFIVSSSHNNKITSLPHHADPDVVRGGGGGGDIIRLAKRHTHCLSLQQTVSSSTHQLGDQSCCHDEARRHQVVILMLSGYSCAVNRPIFSPQYNRTQTVSQQFPGRVRPHHLS